jgi:hypothetical protein
MNRNYIYLLVLLLLWWYLSKSKDKNKINSGDPTDPIIPIVSNFPCQECALKYNEMEEYLNYWINESKLLMIQSSTNDTEFRYMRNEYQRKVKNFLLCIKDSSIVSPVISGDPNFCSSTNYNNCNYQFTYLVYSNISQSQDPIIRYDPYNVVGVWDLNSQYYLPNNLDVDTNNLLKSKANVNDGGLGIIVDILSINWVC